MTAVAVAGALAVAVVAAWGVLRPFGRGGEPALERMADPLEDQRLSLLRALKDLEEERATGSLTEQDYRELRADTEARAVAVLRALEVRDGAGELAAGLKELRSTGGAVAEGNGHRPAGVLDEGARRRRISAVAIGSVSLGVVMALLAGAMSARAPNGSITGNDFTGSSSSDPVAFFEQRVKAHPKDVAARLDLAQRYLQVGYVGVAIQQYLEALKLDPTNAEAHANLGLMLFRAGKPGEALDAENKALEVDPSYPEALYYKGVIMLQGLHRPADAADAFRSYLQAAPYGSRRDEVEELLKKAESERLAGP